MSKRKWGVVAAAIVGAMGGSAGPALGIVNGQEPHNSDTRFDAVAAFSITNWINGVEQEHNTFGCGTLIAPDTVLLARHLLGPTPYDNPEFLPAAAPGEFSFRFRRKPDGTVGSIAQGWQSFHQVSVREFIIPDEHRHPDVVIAKLTEPVTHITPMEIAPIGKITALVPGVSTVTVAGWGKEGPGSDEGPRGRLLYAEPLVTSVSCLRLFFEAFNLAGSACACGPNMHDSGGAILIGGEDGAPYKLAAVIGTPSSGSLAEPITEPPSPAPLATDRRHDPIVAFGPTAWLREEPPGQPNDGDPFEHEHRYSGVLIAPTQVLLTLEAIGMANPNRIQYSESQLPPAGLFSVRFRRTTGGSVGSVGQGWNSYHHVEVQSFSLDPSPHHTRFVIANLATPVTHIAPMAIASTGAVDVLSSGSPLHVSGWAWADGTGSDMQSRIDLVSGRICHLVNLVGGGAGAFANCGINALNPGSAIVIERRRRVYWQPTVEDLPLQLIPGSTLESEVEIPIAGPPNGESRFALVPQQAFLPVTVTWFELVALQRANDGQRGQIVRASQLFDRCYFADCDRPPLTPVNKCSDINGDGVIDQSDHDLIVQQFGPCVDCGACPCDLDFDCVVGEFDVRVWSRQQSQGRCPCRADLDADGDVDQADLDILLHSFGACDCLAECPEDLNGDRVVDDLDVQVMLNPPSSVCTY